jgi:hypothetical protein
MESSPAGSIRANTEVRSPRAISHGLSTICTRSPAGQSAVENRWPVLSSLLQHCSPPRMIGNFANSYCTVMLGNGVLSWSKSSETYSSMGRRSHCSPGHANTSLSLWPDIDQRRSERVSPLPQEPDVRPRPILILHCWEEGESDRGSTCKCQKEKAIGAWCDRHVYARGRHAETPCCYRSAAFSWGVRFPVTEFNRQSIDRKSIQENDSPMSLSHSGLQGMY